MAQTKQEIEAILEQAGSRPRYQFGQNFMIDQNLVRLVAQAGELTPRDTVIEVGPGTGTLTEELLERAGNVVAVEIDRDLAAVLRERFASRPQFTLIEGDGLDGKHAINSQLSAILDRPRPDGNLKLVANLPYNIASPLIIELLMRGTELLAFTVQKEVALRLVAPAGSDDYGPLSIMAQMLAKVEILRTLGPQIFWPAPRIDSALVRMRRDDRLATDARSFSRFVHAIFSYRRKTLRKAVTQAGFDATHVLNATQFDGSRRPEEFDPAQFKKMYDGHAKMLARPINSI